MSRTIINLGANKLPRLTGILTFVVLLISLSNCVYPVCPTYYSHHRSDIRRAMMRKNTYKKINTTVEGKQPTRLKRD